jgi:glucose-6-phosphate isomerase
MILSSEMLEELSRKTFKKQKIDENLKKDYEILKREYNNIKLENKRIIANAAERLRILSERKSKINLSLK